MEKIADRVKDYNIKSDRTIIKLIDQYNFSKFTLRVNKNEQNYLLPLRKINITDSKAEGDRPSFCHSSA
jgi:hypothetical protein